MIDQEVFKDAWELLCDRFARDPSRPLMLAYYKSLSPQMTTEEFRRAAGRVFEEREFFPRPVDFLESCRPDREAEALEQWEAVREYARGYEAKYEGITAEARRALEAIGGVWALSHAKNGDMRFLRAEFMSLYGVAARIADREERARIGAGVVAYLPAGEDGSEP